MNIRELEKFSDLENSAPKTNSLFDSQNLSGKFDDLPISPQTLESLKEVNITHMTAIQKAIIPHALNGRDILGAAKTGSGKTLSFLIPLLEKLYRLSWNERDGIGGLILTPTRELAMQLFDELWKIGKRHNVSAGLVIGGKGVKEDKERICGVNIVVGTPGRVLQHIDETPGVDMTNVQVFVLDETDRILDFGFIKTLGAIIQETNHQRQTLLLSATQVKNTRELSKLSLHNPAYITTHKKSSIVTPLKLRQLYTVCDPQEKIGIFWSFIKTHLKSKIIAFFSTCKQARYIFEAFSKLRPGIPLRCLFGKMKQTKRLSVFYEFCASSEMVLICTDIASRGLDIPSVDWVLQVDSPENINQYVHRVGRTARYKQKGRALILLLPNEKDEILLRFQENQIPLKIIKINHDKRKSVTHALQALVSANPELKAKAIQGVISYVRHLLFLKKKDTFSLTVHQLQEFSISMGLTTVPDLLL